MLKASRLPFGDGDLDFVRHCSAAYVVPEHVDCSLAPNFAWLARRIIPVDDAHHGVIPIEARQHPPVATLNGLLDRVPVTALVFTVICPPDGSVPLFSLVVEHDPAHLVIVE